MPTKKRRVGFIPRIDVLKIIDQLSYENNLSNSKIINILVEEALHKRGIFNLKKPAIQGKILDNRKSDQRDITNTVNNNNFKNVSQESINKLQKEIDYFSIDTEMYKKFMMFLQFQEKMKNSN